MKNNTTLKLTGVLIICCLLPGIILIKNSSHKKAGEKAAVQNSLAVSIPDTTHYDLYYLKHPYLIKGDQLNDAEKYDSAIYYYREASVKFENESQWENYVWINGYIGRLYLYVAGMNFERALPYLQKSFEVGTQKIRSDHPYMATTCYYLGLYYYKKKLAEKALDMQGKALQILLKNYKEGNIYIADVYDALGDVYANLRFNNIAAEENYLKSIKIIEALPGEEKKSNLTPAYYNLVNLNYLIDNYEKAQGFCYEAIKNAGYVKNHSFYWLEFLDGVLANIYSDQQIFDKAMARLQSAILINYEHNGDKGYLSYYNTSLGDISNRLKKYDSAIVYYKKALALTNTSTIFNDQRQQAATTNYSLGMTYLSLKKYEAALSCLKKSIDTRINIYGSDSWETAIAMQGMGTVYKEEGLPDSALKYFQSALVASTKNYNALTIYTVPFASAIRNTIHSYQVIRDKASVLQQLYFKDTSDARLLSASLAYYCLADTLISSFRSEYDREAAKLIFGRDNNSVYEEAIDCATLLYQKTGEGKYPGLVFNFMDKRKSGLLLEALNEKELLVQAGIPLQEQNLIGSFHQELTFLQSQLDNENSKATSDESVLQTLHTRINASKEKLNALHERLTNSYPFYASMQHKNDTLGLSSLQEYANQAQSLVLEYFCGDKAIYVLGIYKGKARLFKVNRTNELNKYFGILQSKLIAGYVFATKEADFTAFRESSYFIYNALVQQVLNTFSHEIKADKVRPGLIIIPDGPLSYIPFEALVTSGITGKEVDYQKLNYLVKDFDISYDYSTRFLLKNYKNRNAMANPSLLAFSFSREDELKSFNKYDSTALPGTARELKAISLYMKGDFYLGDAATESVFKKEAPAHDILHLAIHGEADSLNSYNSKLIFKSGGDSLNDGNLYAYEIYNLPIKAKLAVLSACESGIGRLNPGEGMFSMARGFVYAGCPSLVISYWRVNDNSSQVIVSDFYKQLSAGDKIDRGLRKAKLDYLSNADRRTAHPANWAAFVAVGNMSPLVKQNNYTGTILITIIILLLLALSIYLMRRK